MRRLLFGSILVPVVACGLTGVLALSWPREPAADFEVSTPIKPTKEKGQPDDVLLEDPEPFALVAGPWLTKVPLPLPSEAKMEELAKSKPLAFLKNCLRRYDYTVQGYELVLKKQERIGGKLFPAETIAVKFREEPFSVFMEWQKGERKAKRTLFVRGENNNQLLVKPAGIRAIAGIVEREPDGEDAKQSGRYPLTEFGIKIGSLRTLSSWEEARKNKALEIKYAGLMKVKEVGDRECFVLERPHYAKPEEEGITSATFYYDKETWLQVGSTLKNKDGELIAEYWFTDVKLNPEFKPDAFTRKALK